MSRNATLPFGEVVTIADNTPTLVLGAVPGVHPTGDPRYGPAPWAMQGVRMALSPRLDARSGRALPTPAERAGAANGTSGPGLSREDLRAVWAALELELVTLENARMARTTPALGVTWYRGAEVGIGQPQALVTVAASTVQPRTPVLLWLDAAQRSAPMAEIGELGWYPATIDANPARDVETSCNGVGSRIARVARPANHAWDQPGVWFVSVPFRVRYLSGAGSSVIYQWAPTDTAPGTQYLPADGYSFGLP